jgi:RNase P subunit RPR2
MGIEKCKECYSVEQGFTSKVTVEGEPKVKVCDQCGAEDSRIMIDEDYGQDR